MLVQVFVRRGRKVVFDHEITVERSRSTRRNRTLVAATTAFQFDIPTKFAGMEDQPKPRNGWDFGSMRDFYKPRSWKEWRGEQYR